MTQTGRRAPPGGHDHVSALLHNSTPQTSRPVSKNALKQTYAEELRAQMAQQNQAKKEAEDLYHSRPIAPRPHANHNRVFNESPSPQADAMSFAVKPQEGRPPSPAGLQHATGSYDPYGLPQYGHHGHTTAPPVPHSSTYGPPPQAPVPPQFASYYSPPHAPPRYDYYQSQGQLPPQAPAMYGNITAHLPPLQPVQSVFPAAAASMYPQQTQHLERPPSPISPDALQFNRPAFQRHQHDIPPPDQQENRPHPQNSGIMGFLRSDSKLGNRKEEQKAAYRAELEAQMRQTQDTRRRQKQAELEEDRRMLSALHVSGNRPKALPGGSVSPQGHSLPAAHNPVTFRPPDHDSGVGEQDHGITAVPAAYSALDYTNPNALGTSGFEATAAGRDSEFWPDSGLSGGRRGGAAGRTSPGVGMPSAAAAAAANGGVVPRGVLVNVESALGETPTLHFKSDKAFLTPAEMAARAAAATTLQQALGAQIEEKKQRKEAEKRAEKERDEAEMRRIKREQEELERKQQNELDCERNPGGAEAARDEVAEAWRRAQEEAAASKRLHGGRGGAAAAARTSPEDRRKSLRGLSERSRTDRGPRVAFGRDEAIQATPGPWAAMELPPPPAVGLQGGFGQTDTFGRGPYGGAGHGFPQDVGGMGKFEQARMEMAADNERMRSQLAAQTADIAALRQRADEFERQSRAAQAELSDARLHMHASSLARSELDALAAAAPEPPLRFDHIPGHRSSAAVPPRGPGAESSFVAARGRLGEEASQQYHPTRDRGFLPDLRPRGGPGGPPSKVPLDRGAGVGGSRTQHATCRTGFMADLPPPAVRQRGAAAATPTPKQSHRHSSARAFAQQLLDEDSPSLVAQSQFIPISAAKAPLEPDIKLRHTHPTRGGVAPSRVHRARTAAPLPPISARHASPGPPAPLQHFDRRFDADSRRQSQPAGGYGESPGKELDAVSSFLDERGVHMRSTEQLAMLQRLRLDGPATDSVEALDEFLAGFVNEGNSSAPLYSSARLPSPERILAESEARGKLLARRPSDMSVSGATLRQVNQATASALNAMAAAETELQPVATPRTAPPQHVAAQHASPASQVAASGSMGRSDAVDAPGAARGGSQMLGVDATDVQRDDRVQSAGDSEELEDVDGSASSEMNAQQVQGSEASAETLESVDVESGGGGGSESAPETDDDEVDGSVAESGRRKHDHMEDTQWL